MVNPWFNRGGKKETQKNLRHFGTWNSFCVMPQLILRPQVGKVSWRLGCGRLPSQGSTCSDAPSHVDHRNRRLKIQIILEILRMTSGGYSSVFDLSSLQYSIQTFCFHVLGGRSCITFLRLLGPPNLPKYEGKWASTLQQNKAHTLP